MDERTKTIIEKLYKNRPHDKLHDTLVSDYLLNFLYISQKEADALIAEYWKTK